MTISKIVVDQWQFWKCHWSMTVFKIVIDRSMTILKGNETCPCMHLYKKCHYSLINDSFKNCHWSINDSFLLCRRVGGVHLYRNCHWSINDSFQIVIDQWQFWKVSRSVLGCTFTETVIDRSMTILEGLKICPRVHLYRKCHWSINDNFTKHPSRKCHWLINDNLLMAISHWL